MDQPGPSLSNAVPQIILESPESPSKPENIDNPNNIPRVGVEIPLGIGLESDDEYEEPSSEEEENVNNVNSDSDDNGPVNQAAPAPVDYGYDDDYIGDEQFTLYTRRDIYALKGWRAYVLERRSCRGFLVPSPPIPERLNLILRAVNGVNWQKSILSCSGRPSLKCSTLQLLGLL